MTEKKRPLTTLVIGEQSDRSALLKSALTQAGYTVLACITSTRHLVEQVGELNPDILVADLYSPDRDTLEDLQALFRSQPLPVVMFAQDEETLTIEKAIRAGVSAYVVNEIADTRLRPLLKVAITHFREDRALRTELEETRHTLAERKMIEKAKGLLMEQRGLDEEAAYQLLRKTAMDGGQRVAELARSLIRAAELLG